MRFDYVAPDTLEAISDLKKEGGVLFSGGTDVFVKMRLGKLTPKLLVDTKRLSTPGVVCENGNLFVYMNVTYTDLLDSSCTNDFPLLREGILKVGSQQIRNRGTPVGNIGNASPAGDFLLMVYLHGGSVLLAPSMREVSIEEVVIGPGKVDIGEEEFIYSVKIPKMSGYVGYFEKVGRRNSLVISIASIGVLLKLEGKLVSDVKIAFGSLAPTVLRLKEIEEQIKGKVFTKELVFDAAEEIKKLVSPISDVRASKEYRRKLAKNLFIKAFYKLGLI